MKLYHGTNETLARIMVEEGIKPRALTGQSQWDHSVKSNPDMVYLTDTYAPYFAAAAAKSGERWAIVEVELGEEQEAFLRPDEDFLEQTHRVHQPEFAVSSLEQRTSQWIEVMTTLRELWPLSLEKLGTVAFEGMIPPEKISRVSYFEPSSNSEIMFMCLDPQISLLNHAIMARKYKGLTAWFFESNVGFRDIDPFFLKLIEPDAFEGFYAQQRTAIKDMLAARDGLELYSRYVSIGEVNEPLRSST